MNPNPMNLSPDPPHLHVVLLEICSAIPPYFKQDHMEEESDSKADGVWFPF